MSQHTKRNGVLLQALYHACQQKRKDILAHSFPYLLQVLCEIHLNLLRGNIPLSTSQYQKLKHQKKIIRLLADRKTSLNREHQVLKKQTGGFLFSLLSAAVPILGNLLGGIFHKG